MIADDEAGGRGIGLGQPDVKRHEPGLCPESDQGQQEQQIGRARRNPAGDRGEIERAGLVPQQNEQHEQKRGPQVRGHQIGSAGLEHPRPLVVERHQKIGGDAHHLPGHEKQQAVAGQGDQSHAGGHQIEEKPGDAQRNAVAIGVEISGSMDRHHRGQSQRDRHEQGREGIHRDRKRAIRNIPGPATRDRFAPDERRRERESNPAPLRQSLRPHHTLASRDQRPTKSDARPLPARMAKPVNSSSINGPLRCVWIQAGQTRSLRPAHDDRSQYWALDPQHPCSLFGKKILPAPEIESPPPAQTKNRNEAARTRQFACRIVEGSEPPPLPV